MRVLTLDELSQDEVSKAKKYISKIAVQGPIEDLYWYMLPEQLLTDKQRQLNPTNGPYRISIEIGRSYIRFELIVRAEMIQNEGGGPLSSEQLIHIYQIADDMAKQLNLITCK
jgi:hypothetical protein